MPDDPKPTLIPADAGQGQQVQIPIDMATLSTAYTNWYRVTGTPEELILDFGLTTQMGQVPTEPIKLNHRLVMSFYTAKRLLNALHWAVNRHESLFGVLEVDLQKRVRGGAPAAAPRPQI